MILKICCQNFNMVENTLILCEILWSFSQGTYKSIGIGELYEILSCELGCYNIQSFAFLNVYKSILHWFFSWKITSNLYACLMLVQLEFQFVILIWITKLTSSVSLAFFSLTLESIIKSQLWIWRAFWHQEMLEDHHEHLKNKTLGDVPLS